MTSRETTVNPWVKSYVFPAPERDPLFAGIAPIHLAWELLDRRRRIADLEREHAGLDASWSDADSPFAELLQFTRRLDVLEGRIAVERRLIDRLRAELQAVAT